MKYPSLLLCIFKASALWAEIQNPWGKVMERSGLRFKKLILINGVKLLRKKSLFLDKFCHIEQDFFGIGVSHSI